MDETPAAPMEVVPGVFVGGVLNDKFVVERKLGEGAMGVVVAAHQCALDRLVAIKFLTVDALKDPEAVSRFESEVKAASRINNEHVPPVYDTGKTSRGTPYMVLEYLDGENLAQRVARGVLGIEQAVRFLVQACHAVEAAHALGIIHRDLKPANLFVAKREGREFVKVLDFGVAKLLRPAGHALDAHQTRPHTIVGTPLYASPEQLESAADVDARSDVWSLGATLFHLLCGEPPFRGTDLVTVATGVKGSTPAPLVRSLRPEVSAELERVVAKCLSKDRDARCASAAELALELGKTAAGDRELQGLLDRIEAQHREALLAFGDGRRSPAPKTPGAAVATVPSGGSTAKSPVPPAFQRTLPARDRVEESGDELIDSSDESRDSALPERRETDKSGEQVLDSKSDAQPESSRSESVVARSPALSAGANRGRWVAAAAAAIGFVIVAAAWWSRDGQVAAGPSAAPVESTATLPEQPIPSGTQIGSRVAERTAGEPASLEERPLAPATRATAKGGGRAPARKVPTERASSAGGLLPNVAIRPATEPDAGVAPSSPPELSKYQTKAQAATLGPKPIRGQEDQ